MISPPQHPRERGSTITSHSRRQTRRLAAPFTGFDPLEHNAIAAERKERRLERKRYRARVAAMRQSYREMRRAADSAATALDEFATKFTHSFRVGGFIGRGTIDADGAMRVHRGSLTHPGTGHTQEIWTPPSDEEAAARFRREYEGRFAIVDEIQESAEERSRFRSRVLGEFPLEVEEIAPGVVRATAPDGKVTLGVDPAQAVPIESLPSNHERWGPKSDYTLAAPEEAAA